MKIDKNKVEMAMARACMSRADIAEKTGYKQCSVSNLLKQGRNNRPEVIGRLAKALGVDPAEIIKAE